MCSGKNNFTLPHIVLLLAFLLYISLANPVMTPSSDHGRGFLMIMAVMGIVYGVIGTSPLYALKGCLLADSILPVFSNVIGIISLFIWSLVLVITIKYISIIMNIDHQGEGGIMVLLNLCKQLNLGQYQVIPLVLGLIGCTLFFSNSIITPAISVLSAIEGLKIVSPNFSDINIIVIAILVLAILFYLQRDGNSGVAKYFGPIMFIWFLTLAILGITNIINYPGILLAFNPIYAIKFITTNGMKSLIILGSVILVVTGAEALYADLGHFGKKPIQLTWMFFIFPCLLLNYLGQGALLIINPDAIANPFYMMAPKEMLQPLVILAIAATIIASQSIINGIFSISWQLMMYNYLPRMKVVHTANQHHRQIFIPKINALLFILTISAVLIFKSSDNLAFAYGFNIAGVMMVTNIMVLIILSHNSSRKKFIVLLVLLSPVIVLDMSFLVSNLINVFEGAWFTIAVAYLIGYVMRTWIAGSRIVNHSHFDLNRDLKEFLEKHQTIYSTRIPGTVVYMSRDMQKVPHSLVAHLHHNKFLHKRMIFISIITTLTPKVTRDRISINKISSGTFSVIAKYGFKETPNISKIINTLKSENIIPKYENYSFFFSSNVAVASRIETLSGFPKKLYIYLSRNVEGDCDFYNIPYHKVLEIGMRYQI